MKTSILQSVAVTFGLCTIGGAHAQYGNDFQHSSNHQWDRQAFASPAPATHEMRGPRMLPQVTGESFENSSVHERTHWGWGDSVRAPGAPSVAVPSNTGFSTPVGLQPSMKQVAVGSGALYAPSGEPIPADSPLPQARYGVESGDKVLVQHYAHGGDNCVQCTPSSLEDAYQDASAAPWIGSVPVESCGAIGAPLMPIKNWFGGGSLLFLDFESDTDRRILYSDAMPATNTMRTSEVDPGAHVGFETFMGRYFGAGRYAFSANYLFFDPQMEESIRMPGAAGDDQGTMPLWGLVDFDFDEDGTPDDVGAPGPGDDHLYGVFDAATAYRLRRDIDIQGLEFNFVSFAIGGALRAGSSVGCGPNAVGGCGGLGGPMLPAFQDRFQLQYAHGIRWFQFRDALEIGASATDMSFETGMDDFYYNVDVENNLFGYQFGTLASYVLTPRVSSYVGAKFGIYGNDADYRARIGTRDVAGQANSFYPSYEDEEIAISRNETVLATVGELDLGLAMRLTRCWSLTGGYRLLGATGIATSVGAISEDPANTLEGHFTSINESLLLHGGYVGLLYNW